MTIHIGIDLGGTNLRAAVFSPVDGTLSAHLKDPVGEPRDPVAIVERIAHIFDVLVPAGEDATLGIGLAAMLRDRRGTVARSPHLRWTEVPFGKLLADRLGPRVAIGVYNDVNAIVWGESIAGAARGCANVLGVYVGTGIGGGVISGGRLVEGTTNCAGEIGHVKVRWDDKAEPCACGQRGCVEAYVGGSYVAKRIAAELAAGARSKAVELAGAIERVTPGHVDTAAGEGDEWALGLWTELAPLLAVALGNACSILNPERLILGGGMLGRAPTLHALVETELLLVAPKAITDPLTVVSAQLADDAGLVGSAALAASRVSTFRAGEL